MTPSLLAQVTDLRVGEPELLTRLYAERRRHPKVTASDRLVIIAADHPARYVVAAGGDPWAMADRADYLDRILRVLSCRAVDGVMATPDLLDELLLLGHLLAKQGEPNPVCGKLLIGCLNRGGLAGAAWELDDFWTGHTPESLLRQGLDGGKLLLRINLQHRDSAATLRFAADAVERLAQCRLPVFIEPLPVEPTETGGWRVVKTPERLVPLLGVASALGSTSAYSWLKLPMVPEMARVAAATTLPILLLGGESAGDPAQVLAEIEVTSQSAPNVRGLMIGRNVLYPGAGVDPRAMAIAVANVARGLWDRTVATAYLRKEEDL
ncbi:MAG TPA: deoxyribose-phosphate aldolase [Symbiobacteriaceae bacterium]|nr:deoxyribose-phosphate aldolase [Symbiobacteriaceae bacterium]